MPTITVAEIDNRIREAAVWCDFCLSSGGSFSTSFWSADLRPAEELYEVTGDSDFFIEGKHESYMRKVPQCIATVDRVADLRRRLIVENQLKLPEGKGWPTNLKGRLLLYSPSDSTCDEESRRYSDGFFGDYDSPPWDTWVAYIVDHRAVELWETKQVETEFPDFLVSWVPADVVPIVQEALGEMFDYSLDWIEYERIVDLVSQGE